MVSNWVSHSHCPVYMQIHLFVYEASCYRQKLNTCSPGKCWYQLCVCVCVCALSPAAIVCSVDLLLEEAPANIFLSFPKSQHTPVQGWLLNTWTIGNTHTHTHTQTWSTSGVRRFVLLYSTYLLAILSNCFNLNLSRGSWLKVLCTWFIY